MKVRSLYPVIVVPLLAGILIAVLLRAYAFSATHAAPGNTTRVALAGHVNAALSTSHLVAHVAGSQQITLAVGLNLRNQADLTAYLQQVTQPQSSLYHHYLNASSFSTLYGPLPTSETVVVNFLRAQGFTITKTYNHHMIVDVRGTAAEAEKTFQVHLNTYQAADGHLFYSNDTAPSLPTTIASLISSVTGLDSSLQYTRSPLKPGTATIKMGTAPQAPRSANSNASTLCPQPGSPNYGTSYTPAQIATAYDFTPLYNAGNLGEGQTVGLLELDGFSARDIATYTACFGGKNTVISTIPIDGYNGAAGPNASEVELDMEMVLGLAPRLASLRVYEASNQTLNFYNDAWARIISDDTPVVSTSWVYCEQDPHANIASEIQQESQFFQAAAAQGQTILAASGDSGANGCYNPSTHTGVAPSADDPASQPFVTGVGGTTLNINFDNTYKSERVWNDRALGNGASGGGLSSVWSLPRWQQGPGVANSYSTGHREVPDVAVNADPQTGYDIYCSAGGCAGSKGWHAIGGTSAAAPVWAALIALANEASVKANGYLMGFLNPSLYSINYGSPGTSYATAFHDIVPQVGPNIINNNDYVGTSGTYPDSTMYDMATGLGSFDAYNLTQNLITLSKSSLPRTTATNTTWYFAEGRAGGNFQEFLTLENPDPIQTAQVQVQYLLETGIGPKITHAVLPQSRATVNVNNDLNYPYAGPSHSLAMIVTSLNGVGVVAERPMYFSWHGINSGTDTLGATTLGQDFYFADVESLRSFYSFITILNPPGGQSANVTVSYLSGGKLVSTATLVVPAGQRGTTAPTGNFRAAVHVHSDQPVMVERPTYFSTARSNITGSITGASTLVGAAAPGNDWLFAEGYTGANFHEYLVLANFDATATATVTVKLEYSNGQVNPVTVKVLPQSQTLFDVNAASSAFAQSTAELSAEVVSDAPIVAQRTEYFRFSGSTPGGTDVIGEPGPAKTNYSFAEGYTTNGFSEFLTLQNPNATPENVAVTLYLANSISTQKIVSVGPQTRVTISINSIVVPIAQGNPGAGYEVSLSVQAMTGTVVAERPIYFQYHNTSFGGSDVVGYTG